MERQDMPKINSWRNNPELISFLGAPFRYINQEVDYAWFDNYMKTRSNTIRLSIVNENNELIGLVSLVNIDYINQSAELHIMIGDSVNQNQGAGTFAVREIIKHAFMNMNLQRIELAALASNSRAIHMYEKIGFIYEGTKRKAKYKQGAFEDIRIYSIIKSEYVGDVEL